MNYITKNLKQKGLYWGAPTAAGIGFTYADAVEVNCRFEQRQELFVDAEGRERVSRAVVFVDQDVEVGGQFALGSLSDLYGDSSSSAILNDPTLMDSFKIRAFEKTPNLKATLFERTIWL